MSTTGISAYKYSTEIQRGKDLFKENNEQLLQDCKNIETSKIRWEKLTKDALTAHTVKTELEGPLAGEIKTYLSILKAQEMANSVLAQLGLIISNCTPTPLDPDSIAVLSKMGLVEPEIVEKNLAELNQSLVLLNDYRQKISVIVETMKTRIPAAAQELNGFACYVETQQPLAGALGATLSRPLTYVYKKAGYEPYLQQALQKYKNEEKGVENSEAKEASSGGATVGTITSRTNKKKQSLANQMI